MTGIPQSQTRLSTFFRITSNPTKPLPPNYTPFQIKSSLLIHVDRFDWTVQMFLSPIELRYVNTERCWWNFLQPLSP